MSRRAITKYRRSLVVFMAILAITAIALAGCPMMKCLWGCDG
jgi:hypothetical protein